MCVCVGGVLGCLATHHLCGPSASQWSVLIGTGMGGEFDKVCVLAGNHFWQHLLQLIHVCRFVENDIVWCGWVWCVCL